MKETLFKNMKNKSFEYFYNSLLKAFIMYIAIVFIYLTFNSYNIQQIYIPILIGFLYIGVWIIIPLVVLYLNHSRYTRGVLVFNKNIGEYTYFNDVIITFKINDIDKIVYKQSQPTRENKSINWFFWDKYYYIVVILKDSKMLKFSCLIDADKSHLLPKSKVIKERKIFPYIPKNKI